MYLGGLTLAGGVKRFEGVAGRFAGLAPGWPELEELRYHAQVFKRGHRQEAPDLRRALADGATLYFKNVGRRLAPVAAVVEEVRVATRARWWEAALVLTDGRQPGFGVHRDASELAVLQLVGQKGWTVFAGGALGAVAFQDELRDGDVLYVPRDWWHCCEPVGESVHLTVSFRR